MNLAALHGWLRREHGYEGSLRSVQRYWRRAYPAPAVRARRRVETPAGAQAQVDWAHFPGLLVGGEAVDLVALHMVLSWSRREAIVWAPVTGRLVLAELPHGLLRAAGRGAGGGAGGQRADGGGAGRRGVGHDQRGVSALRDGAAVPCRCLRTAAAAGQGQSRAPGARPAAGNRPEWAELRGPRSAAGLDRWPTGGAGARSGAARRAGRAWRRPGHEERVLLTPLPAPLPEPFDVVVMRPVGRDGLVSLRGPAIQRAVPADWRDGRGAWRRRGGADPQSLHRSGARIRAGRRGGW